MSDLTTTSEPASESGRKHPLGRFVCRVVSGVTYWMPVWVPLGLLAQLGLLGLKPALIEERRLEQAETRLAARLAGLREERDELEHELAAFEDPIYLERLRRLRDAD